jgi:hypothetical protein
VGRAIPYGIYDTVTVGASSISPFTATANWTNRSKPFSVAASLARAFNTPLLPVTASANGAVVTMVAVGFTPSFSVSYNNTDFQSFRYIQRGSRRRKIVASGHDIHLRCSSGAALA